MSDQLLDTLVRKPRDISLNAPASDAIARKLTDVDAQPGLLKSGLVASQGPSTAGFNTSLGMAGADGLNDALKMRAKERSNAFVNKLKRNVDYEAPMNRLRGEQNWAKGYGTQTGMALQNEQKQLQYDLDRKRVDMFKQQQKDAVLASILGLVGTVVGTVAGSFAGNPGAGAALGNAGGQAIAGAVKK